MKTVIKNIVIPQYKIFLSSQGGGDYNPVEWVGDLSRPCAEIAAECKILLSRAVDKDTLLTEGEIIEKIINAKNKPRKTTYTLRKTKQFDNAFFTTNPQFREVNYRLKENGNIFRMIRTHMDGDTHGPWRWYGTLKSGMSPDKWVSNYLSRGYEIVEND